MQKRINVINSNYRRKKSNKSTPANETALLSLGTVLSSQ